MLTYKITFICEYMMYLFVQLCLCEYMYIEKKGEWRNVIRPHDTDQHLSEIYFYSLHVKTGQTRFCLAFAFLLIY